MGRRMSDGQQPLPVVRPDQLPRAEPLFERIAIFGLGFIGGYIALAARQVWPSALVIGVYNNDVLEAAMLLHAVDVGADDPVVAAEADLVVLAAPVLENVRLVAEIAEHLRGSAVVTDVGGSKRAVVDAAAGLPARLAGIRPRQYAADSNSPSIVSPDSSRSRTKVSISI